MYERLTIRHPHPHEDFITINETKQLPDTEQSRKVLNRLCEIEDKIEQGKIVELPCEIGDDKFAILPNTNVIVKGKVCTIIYQNGFLIDFGYAPNRFGGYTAYTQLLPEELFGTYEEAEAKLREMEGDNNEQR